MDRINSIFFYRRQTKKSWIFQDCLTLISSLDVFKSDLFTNYNCKKDYNNISNVVRKIWKNFYLITENLDLHNILR